MSVINKMLKDLESQRRGSGFNQGEEQELLSDLRTSHKGAFKLRSPFIILIVLIVIALGLFGYLFFSPNQMGSKISLPLLVHPAKQQATTSKDVVFEKQTAVILQKAQWQAEQQNASLVLFGSGEVHYQVQHQSDSAFAIRLFGVTLAPDLKLNVPDAWITDLSSKQVGDDVVINFVLNKDVEFIGLGHSDSDNTQVVIKFVNPQLQPGVANNAMEKEALPLSLDQTVADEYRQAMDFVSQQQTDQAIYLLGKILSKKSDYLPARQTLALLLMKQGRLAQADKLLIVGLIQNPDDINLVKMRAEVLVRQGNIAQALAILQQHTPALTEHASYYAFLAALYQQNGQYTLAAQIYDQLTKVFPDNAMWWLGLGVSLESAGTINQANEAYRQALKIGADLPLNVRSFLMKKVNQ